MKSVVQSTATKFGLIAVAINVGWLLFAYLVDLELLVHPFMGIALWVVGLVIYILAVNSVKKQFGGFISFREAFSTFILAYIINALISVIFTVVLFNFVDPSASEKVMELTISKSVEMFENFGMSDEQIDEAIARMESENNFSLGNQIQGLLMGIVIYAIIGLIVSAIMKKKRPEHLEYEESSAQ